MHKMHEISGDQLKWQRENSLVRITFKYANILLHKLWKQTECVSKHVCIHASP